MDLLGGGLPPFSGSWRIAYHRGGRGERAAQVAGSPHLSRINKGIFLLPPESPF